MDYFKQRRAYRNFKVYEASVSNGQNNLYRELLDYANDEGKLDAQFRMKNSALLSLTGLSEPGLDRARNSLVQLGLISYVKGKKNVKPPEYKIVNLYSRSTGYPTSNPTRNENSMPASSDEVGQPVGQGGGQPVGHKELTNTDLDSTGTDSVVDDGTPQSSVTLWENLWGWPNAIAIQDLADWSKEFGEELLCWAITYAAKRNVQAKGADRYIERIAEGWRQKKITTVVEAEAADKEHQRQLNNARGGSVRPHSGRTPHVEKEPDWQKKLKAGETPTNDEQLDPAEQARLDARIASQKEAKHNEKAVEN